MKHKDFQIGTVFCTSVGIPWRCTDVGTRTITAIELTPGKDVSWFNGPPYAVAEQVFDEHDFPICAIYSEAGEIALIQERIEEADKRLHPGYDMDDVKIMMSSKVSTLTQKYPNRELLRIDRVSDTGKIYHPYAAEQMNNNQWNILVLDVFARKHEKITELEFLKMRISTDADLLIAKGVVNVPDSDR